MFLKSSEAFIVSLIGDNGIDRGTDNGIGDNGIGNEKGQKQPSKHSCTELSETQFFHVSIVNIKKRLKNNDISSRVIK